VEVESARGRPLFAVGGDVYRWHDVVRLAELHGDWDAIAGDARAGLEALGELERRGEALSAEEVDGARREFRYARGLLAAEELTAWLDQRGLARADLRGYLERLVARGRLPDPRAAPGVEQSEIDACVWPEGICSGRLEELARTLARLAAVCPGTPLEALDGAFDAFRRTAAGEAEIAREIEANRLEWLRLVYEAADFASEDAALEAALCIRSDGDSLADVAARAGVAVERRDDWLEGMAPDLASGFLAARPGDLVGPVRAEERFRLAVLHEKTPPSTGDDDVRARAADAAIERAIARATNERVVWLEPL
jgi:hypothetical protein